MLLIDAFGNYPRYIGDLQLAHPEWQEGEPLPSGWREVEETPAPDRPGRGAGISFGVPQYINGKFVQTWKITKLTPEQILESDKRFQEIIALSSKTAVGAAPEEESIA